MLEIIKSKHSGRAVQRCVHQGLLGSGLMGSRPRAQGHRAEARQGNESEAAARLFNQGRDKREERVKPSQTNSPGLSYQPGQKTRAKI